jgi:hypothetical protein
MAAGSAREGGPYVYEFSRVTFALPDWYHGAPQSQEADRRGACDARPALTPHRGATTVEAVSIPITSGRSRQRLGALCTVMVTGDSAVTAAAIAREVGLSDAVCPRERLSDEVIPPFHRTADNGICPPSTRNDRHNRSNQRFPDHLDHGMVAEEERLPELMRHLGRERLAYQKADDDAAHRAAAGALAIGVKGDNVHS